MPKNFIKIGAIVSIAWFAACALTPMTSVAIRNSSMTSTAITASTLDSTPIGATSPSTVRSSYFTATSTPPNPAPSNTSMEGWNATAGGGETDYINNYGGGSNGGFLWMSTGSPTGNSWNTSQAQMFLSKAGALSIASSFSTPSTATAALFVGPLSGNVTGNVSGTVTGSLVGNASTASAFNHTPAACPTAQVVQAISSTGAPTCVNGVQSGSGPGGTTGSSSFSSTTSIVTFSPGYGDTNYRAACTLIAPSDPRAVINGITVLNPSSLTVEVSTMGSISISYAGVDCLLQHP